MTQDARNEAERGGLLHAHAIVQKYKRTNDRRLRVADICDEIKRLINEEISRLTEPNRQ